VRIVRVDDGRPRFAIVEDDLETLSFISGEPFDREIVRSGDRTSLSRSRLMTPVSPSKILAIGRNYAAHAREMDLPMGEQPSAFLKPLQTLVPDGGTVVLPPRSVSTHVEHEAELAVVIGRTAHAVKARDAADYILGFTCANDVSARDLQRADPQLTRGKGFDTFCPLGAAIETDVSPYDTYEVVCQVNGEERQRGTTEELIFPIPVLVEWFSSWTTLVPGDVILTGSPAGTGRMEPGDDVRIRVSGVATLRHRVAASDEDVRTSARDDAESNSASGWPAYGRCS
jgi:2-keto-4-pentenoate hydratase/2-oxohepta-3-ene-1,7-dioic acid hydratase in catechol pathway